MEKELSKSISWLLKHGLTVAICVLIVTLGTISLAHSSPGTTVIGENIGVAGTISEGGTLLSEKYLGIPENSAQGDIVIRDATGWTRLGAGISDQYLKTQGAGANPVWSTVNVGGLSSVTSSLTYGATEIFIPKIVRGDTYGTLVADWVTRIQVMNVGTVATDVTLEIYKYGEGGVVQETVGPISFPANSSKSISFTSSGNLSGVLTSSGQPIVAAVAMSGTDPYGEFQSAAAYTGISETGSSPYAYYLPSVMNGYDNLTTLTHIQNAGSAGATFSIYYYNASTGNENGQSIDLTLDVGEAIKPTFPTPECNAPWLGTAKITSDQPLAIFVDKLSKAPDANWGTLSSYEGNPKERGSSKVYSPLAHDIFAGWTSYISTVNQGDSKTFLAAENIQGGDGVCEACGLLQSGWAASKGGGSGLFLNTTGRFWLPAIFSFGVSSYQYEYSPFASIVQSAQQYSAGTWYEAQDFSGVAESHKSQIYEDTTGFWRGAIAGEKRMFGYTALPADEVETKTAIALPLIRQGLGNWTESIAILNANQNSGYTSVKVKFYNETGTKVGELSFNLKPQEVKLIDSAISGVLSGSSVVGAIVEATATTQVGDTAIAAVAEGLGNSISRLTRSDGGDFDTAYTGIPIKTQQ